MGSGLQPLRPLHQKQRTTKCERTAAVLRRVDHRIFPGSIALVGSQPKQNPQRTEWGPDLAFHLALTLLKIAAVKRTKLLIARLIFSILCLSALSISTTLGDDARAGAAAPKPANDPTDPKKETPESKKDSAEPAKEEAEAKQLKLIK